MRRQLEPDFAWYRRQTQAIDGNMPSSRVGFVAVLLSGTAAIGGCAATPLPAATAEAPKTAGEAPKTAEPKAEPDALLVEADLSKLVMGVDSEEDVARKLKASAPGACTHPYGGTELTTEGQRMTKDRRKTVCWQRARTKDAPDLVASFYDYGIGPVVYDLWLDYPSSSWSWLPASLEAAMGAPNHKIEQTGQRIWNRGDTDVSVGGTECSDDSDRSTCKTISVALTHWPTLKLSTAGVTDRKTSVAGQKSTSAP
jgi:hypothetical protein